MTDEEIDTSDCPPPTDEIPHRAVRRMPRVTVTVDPETLAWFRSQGDSAEKEMSAALRIYADAHRS